MKIKQPKTKGSESKKENKTEGESYDEKQSGNPFDDLV